LLLLLKSLEHNDFEHAIRENIARARIYLWLGLQEEIEHIFDGMDDEGYGLSEKYMNDLGLPTEIFYNNKLSFELRSHIYQGRDMLGFGLLSIY
jgi:hypothetical protein